MTERYLKHNSIKISAITPRGKKGLDDRVKREPELFDVYKGSLKAATCLSSNGLFYDGWLLLNLSVECFFKYLYLLVRPEFEKNFKPKKEFPLGPMEYDGSFLFYHDRALDGKLPMPRDFGHEVMELYELFARFTDAVEDKNFAALRNSIPSEGQWVTQRYSLRNDLGKKKQFEDYLSDFDGALNNIFKELR